MLQYVLLNIIYFLCELIWQLGKLKSLLRSISSVMLSILTMYRYAWKKEGKFLKDEIYCSKIRHLIKTVYKITLTLNITLAKLKLFSLSIVFVRKFQGEQEHRNYERGKNQRNLRSQRLWLKTPWLIINNLI